jgi:hypothetical protein
MIMNHNLAEVRRSKLHYIKGINLGLVTERIHQNLLLRQLITQLRFEPINSRVH